MKLMKFLALFKEKNNICTSERISIAATAKILDYKEEIMSF